MGAGVGRPFAALPVADELVGYVEDVRESLRVQRQRLAQQLERLLVAEPGLRQLYGDAELELLEVFALDDDLSADLALLRGDLGDEGVTAGVDLVIEGDGNDPLPLAPIALLHFPPPARPAAWEKVGNEAQARQGRWHGGLHRAEDVSCATPPE